MTTTIAYYRVKQGRAYWQPTPLMQKMGFQPRALGPDGEEARQEARTLNREWADRRALTSARDRSKASTSRPGYIYFLFADSMVKIGFSKTPTARTSQLQTAMPLQLTALVILPGERQLDKKLHALFSKDHSHREWFRASDGIRRLVQRSVSFGKIMLETDEKLERSVTISNFRQIA